MTTRMNRDADVMDRAVVDVAAVGVEAAEVVVLASAEGRLEVLLEADLHRVVHRGVDEAEEVAAGVRSKNSLMNKLMSLICGLSFSLFRLRKAIIPPDQQKL
jgi:hypothetical protein